MQAGLPVLASINPGNDLEKLIEQERVGHVCTDHSVDILQRLAVELAEQVATREGVSARCRALSEKLFSPAAAVKQITAALVI
jgi:glycosyltransferase involved in cell wall biosynthesis